MKPGILTSEFWLTVAASVLIGIGGVDVPAGYEWLKPVLVVLTIIGYAISRGLAKQAQPYPVAVPSGPTPDPAAEPQPAQAGEPEPVSIVPGDPVPGPTPRVGG